MCVCVSVDGCVGRWCALLVLELFVYFVIVAVAIGFAVGAALTTDTGCW